MRRNDTTLLENFQAFFRESVAIHVAGRNFAMTSPSQKADQTKKWRSQKSGEE
ncbi:MAG: hypothetical protein WCD04_15820 [Terriglobia bacterium]